MLVSKEIKITKEYLETHKNEIFVYGDNIFHLGKAGGAILRDEENVLGFVTKKYPSNNDDAFYTPEEYLPVFEKEVEKLVQHIIRNPMKQYLISKIGAGLANRYNIFEQVIKPRLSSVLKYFPNVTLLWD